MDIGVWHPQVVHFVIALFFVGLGLRLLSLIRRISFANHAATLLIVLSAFAAVIASKSGDDAHGVAERIPGVREAVINHEEWGHRTRTLFLGIAVLELAILAVSVMDKRAATATTASEKRRRIGMGMRIGSSVLGLIGAFFLFETAEHGGQIVYEFAGGVGTRHGEPEHVQNLLVAGLYHAAVQDREAGRKQDAARLIEEMVRRHPDDDEIRLLAIESMIKDRDDPRTALNLLTNLSPPAEERMRVRAGMLRVDAYEAAGMADSAQASLTRLKQEFPANQRVAARQLTVKPMPPAPVVKPESAAVTTTTGQ